MTATSPTKARRWVRFGIRSLLVLTLLAAIPLTKFNRVRAQRRTVAAIVDAGGRVAYDFMEEFRRQNPNDPRWLDPDYHGAVPEYEHPDWPGPALLRGLFGHDLFAHVVKVNLEAIEGSPDEILAGVGALPKVSEVSARGISTVGMEHLARAPSLRVLWLSGDVLVADSVDHVEKCAQLEELHLGYRRVNGDAVARLAACATLQRVYIDATLTDEGVAHLAAMTQLQVLALPHTPLSEASVEALARASHLKKLEVDGDHLPRHGLSRLRDALPKCQVR